MMKLNEGINLVNVGTLRERERERAVFREKE